MSREQFIKMESTPHEDAMKTGEMTTDSEYYKNLVDKAVAGFVKTDSNLFLYFYFFGHTVQLVGSCTWVMNLKAWSPNTGPPGNG